MEIDETAKKILDNVGIYLNEDSMIDRDIFLHMDRYNNLKNDIIELKKKISSSSLTSLHKDADVKQKWPLINLIRQILHIYGYKMIPVRKCDGYTTDGIKKFKRFFLIQKSQK